MHRPHDFFFVRPPKCQSQAMLIYEGQKERTLAYLTSSKFLASFTWAHGILYVGRRGSTLPVPLRPGKAWPLARSRGPKERVSLCSPGASLRRVDQQDSLTSPPLNLREDTSRPSWVPCRWTMKHFRRVLHVPRYIYKPRVPAVINQRLLSR